MKKIFLTTILVVLSVNSYAVDQESAQHKNQFLKQFYVVGEIGELEIIQKFGERKAFEVTSDLKFSSKKDHHVSTTYKVREFDLHEGYVVLEYYYKADMRSFGKDIISTSGQFRVFAQ